MPYLPPAELIGKTVNVTLIEGGSVHGILNGFDPENVRIVVARDSEPHVSTELVPCEWIVGIAEA